MTLMPPHAMPMAKCWPLGEKAHEAAFMPIDKMRMGWVASMNVLQAVCEHDT